MPLATREQLLTQIEAVLASISGVATCARNRGSLIEDEAPAIILLDGSEELVSNVVQQKSVLMPPAIFKMIPQIFAILQKRDDVTNTTVNGVFKPVGPEINYWRDAILGALINDPTLIEMLTANGQLVFKGMRTDMATGATMQGQLQLFIELHYVWSPQG